LKERYNLDEYKGGSMPQLGQARQPAQQMGNEQQVHQENGPAGVKEKEDRSAIHSPGLRNINLS